MNIIKMSTNIAKWGKKKCGKYITFNISQTLGKAKLQNRVFLCAFVTQKLQNLLSKGLKQNEPECIYVI